MAEAKLRTARCGCGELQITVQGEPRRVYACTCLECQRCTGSALAYRAIYSEAAVVARSGEGRRWRRIGTSGQWLEQTFCPTCGSVLYMRAEGLVGALSISVGCFGDPEFPAPAADYWPERRHGWLRLPSAEPAA